MWSGVIRSMVRSHQELCSPGGLRQGCEILEDREGGPGGESAQETVVCIRGLGWGRMV